MRPIRSNFAITRLIVLPYGILLTLYLLVVIGGGAWLYLQLREAESQLLVDEMLTRLAPVVDRVAAADDAPGDAARLEAARGLFAILPALRKVSLRDAERGIEMRADAGDLRTGVAEPLPPGSRRVSDEPPVARRLQQESGAVFVIRFDLRPEGGPPLRLEFGFDRERLLARLDAALRGIQRAVTGFALVGAISILLATGITWMAMRATRRIESHFQQLYRRASLTEIAAELVHELRNPLMALRGNASALRVAPEQAREIAIEMDRDIVSLNDKLSGFLQLARSAGDTGDFTPSDIGALIADAARLAEPVLANQGLTLRIDAPRLPEVPVRADAMRDVLLNLLLNAARSGQRRGAIRVRAWRRGDAVHIAVEDRGDGIDPALLPRLFDAFFTTREDGNGLGLAIARRVVAAHHGRIFAMNRDAGGARFEIVLPLKQQEPPHWWKALKRSCRD